jgi:K(+)-stimulated pyrophosphate-energized sodium pump
LATAGTAAHATSAAAQDSMEYDISAPTGKLNESGDFVYDTGTLKAIKLPNGETLNIGQSSQISYLADGLSKNDQTLLEKEKWFTIENLYFETGSEKLKAGAETQLDNIARLLNAYPNLRVKLGGYTDNTGNEGSNKTLSNLRAQSAKLYLMNLGIAADRVEAEGYGSQFPVCPANDTDECKAQNRRIDVRVLSF